MRRRDVDPALWQDEKFGNLSIGAQLLFIWCWNDADDWGVLRWRVERCKSGAFLYKPRINLGHVREYMGELEAARMICSWDVSGERWAVVRMFLRWQSVNKPAQSKCAAPPSDVVALLPDPIDWRSYKNISKGMEENTMEVPGWVASCVRDRSRGRSPGPGSGADSDSEPKNEQKNNHPSDGNAPSPRKPRTPKHDKLRLDTETWEWVNVTPEIRGAWAVDYPGIDVDEELRKARAWVRADPGKRKKSNWVKFVAGWFGRAQDKVWTQPQRLPLVDNRTTQLQAEREWQKVAKTAATRNNEQIAAAHEFLGPRTLDSLRQFNRNTMYAIIEMVDNDARTLDIKRRQFLAAWIASELDNEAEAAE